MPVITHPPGTIFMSKIKVGIIGLGHMGKFHARILSETQDANFTAVYDHHTETANQIAEKYGAHAVDTLEEFAGPVDPAIIATPTPFHFETGKFLLERGKHLLIEKPIAETTADAK